MPERFREAHRAGLARYVATGEARVIGKTVELAGRRNDGTEFPLELSLAAWKHGSEVAFTAIIRDITARKEGEDQRRRYAAQLEAANKELEAFSYSVSHDCAPRSAASTVSARRCSRIIMIGSTTRAATSCSAFGRG